MTIKELRADLSKYDDTWEVAVVLLDHLEIGKFRYIKCLADKVLIIQYGTKL